MLSETGEFGARLAEKRVNQHQVVTWYKFEVLHRGNEVRTVGDRKYGVVDRNEQALLAKMKKKRARVQAQENIRKQKQSGKDDTGRRTAAATADLDVIRTDPGDGLSSAVKVDICRELFVKSLGLALLLFAVHSRATTEEPQWLLDARVREGQLIEPHVVTSADKHISFSVPVALSGELKEDKDSYEALFTLGPQAAADCEILNADIDVAALLRETARTTFSDVIEKAQGKIEKRVVEHIDAGVAGATPYLGVVWLYRVNDGKGAKLGALRQYAATRSGHGIYCALNDLGYAKTFENVVHALIESLETKDDEEAPYFSEISVATVRDMRIGYSALTMHRDKDGDTKCVDTTVLLTTMGSEALQSRDSVYVEWIKPDGALINGKRVVSNNGEVEMNLALKPGDGGTWRVEGKFKGKDVKETIPGGVPSTWLSQTNLLRTMLAKEKQIGAEASESEWLGADPGRFTDMSVKVLAAVDANTYSVRETTGNSSVDLVVDRATGQATHGITQLGPAEIRFDRIYVQGSP
jgi:hypothetical protein